MKWKECMSAGSYEYVLMDPAGRRIAYGYENTLIRARGKSEGLLIDYPRCFCRIYYYSSLDADPVLVEVVR